MGDKIVAVELRFGELRVGSCNARIGDCNVYRGVKAYLYFLLDLSGTAEPVSGLSCGGAIAEKIAIMTDMSATPMDLKILANIVSVLSYRDRVPYYTHIITREN